MQIDDRTRARFWSYVACLAAGEDDCWEWTATVNRKSKNHKGYGKFGFGGKDYVATHVALILDGRPRPEGMQALHSCDNPLCCNPAHLRWGTHLDNMVDAYHRGGLQRSFTDEEAEQVRQDRRPYKQIAAEHGCSYHVVALLKCGETYKQPMGI